MDWRIEHRFKDKVPNIVYYVDVFNGSLQFCPQVFATHCLWAFNDLKLFIYSVFQLVVNVNYCDGIIN